MADGIEVAWSGLDKLYAAIDRLGTQADAAAREIVAKSAALLEAAAKANFAGAHKKGQPHVGGDKPNVVTGSLRRSIRADPVVQSGSHEFSTRVGPRTVYARRVELGYQGSKGYPYFAPAYRQVQPQLEALAAATWRKYMLG